MSGSQTLVVKLGTSVLTGGSRRLNRAHMVELVRQCAQQHAAGHRIVIVTCSSRCGAEQYSTGAYACARAINCCVLNSIIRRIVTEPYR